MDTLLSPTAPRSERQEAISGRLLAFAQQTDAGARWTADGIPPSIYRTLIASTVDIPDESPPRRQPSLFPDGTKAGFSFQAQIHPRCPSERPALRALVEPGGIGLNLAAQIDFALATLDRLLRQLAWTHLAGDLNRFARIAFPENPSHLDTWWGGLWLGAEISGEETDLRIYLNLRSGSAAERWQRVADMLAPHAPKTMEPAFLSLAERVHGCSGIPVGLAVVLKAGRLHGIRLYAGIAHPTPESVCAAMPLETGSAGPLRGRLESLVDTFGPFEGDAITVAYDFPFRGGSLLPGIARFKADVGCSGYQEQASSRFGRWLEADLGPAVFPRFQAFTRLMARTFGGSHLNYLSFGFRQGGIIERTCYLQPLGIAPELP